jgi:hypothetical protein
VSDSEEKLRAVLETLEQCQATLIALGKHDMAHTVSLGVLELRMEINRIDDSELRTLCDAMVRGAETAAEAARLRPQEAPRPRPPVSLKLVK